MKHHINILNIIFSIATMLLIYSCASIGNPSGGPRDEEPPQYIRSNPPFGATNFNRQKVQIEFDEIVNVKDAFKKVSVSPTSKNTPRVTALGRTVSVSFEDSLLANETYTIDFADCIEDNNEGNKLKNFTFAFSTGNNIDSLQISGIVLNSHTLEPQQGIVVGAHRNLNDSAFKTLRLERITKTNDKGQFTLRNLKPEKYRIFALADINNDYRWDNPAEDIAFLDSLITPYNEFTTVTDTIWNFKTREIDTIVSRTRTRFLPNDILLNTFNINYKTQYLVKNERIDSTRISLVFNTKSDSLPKLELIGEKHPKDWFVLERSANNDTLTYWLKDTTLTSIDSLKVAVTYLLTDSTQMLSPTTDTLRMITTRPKIKKSKKKSKSKSDSITAPEIRFLNIRTITNTSHEIYNPIILEFDEPIKKIAQNGIKLEHKVDTIWEECITTGLNPVDSLNIRRYQLAYDWEFGESYRLKIDSVAITGIYEHFNKPFEHSFSLKKEDDYRSLTLRITDLTDSTSAFVELLNQSDNIIGTTPVVDGIATFPYLAKNTYYARLVEDRNSNGIYDTGSYDELLQPENVFYYPKAITLKRSDISQEWKLNDTPIDMQKPDKIKKNKPEQPRTGKRTSREEEEYSEDEEYFDVEANPFDPESNKRRNNNRTNRNTRSLTY